MNMVRIICPKCGAEKKLSLVETTYVGPQRCWKCRELFTITIINNQVQSSEPLSEEEYERQQEAKKAREKMGNFMEPVSREEAEKPAAPKAPPEKFRTFLPPQAPGREEPKKSTSPVSPPDRFRTFVPMEDPGPAEPKKPAAPKPPPDRFRTFIPPAT
jgi:hypothetical protein